MAPREPSEEDFDKLDDVEMLALLRLLAHLAELIAMGEPTGAVTKRLAVWLGAYMGWGWLIGAARTLKEVDGFSSEDQPSPEVLAKVQGAPPPLGVRPVQVDMTEDSPLRFREAIKALSDRDPRLAANAQAVSNVMRQGGFAAARSATVHMTRRVQAELVRMDVEGRSKGDTAEIVRRLTGWTRSYTDTVVQTNAATAYAQGRFEQARRLGAQVAPAFEVIGPKDSIARKNHVAAIGLVAAVNDPIWNELMPPLGYNCRHSVSVVPRAVLKRRGLLSDRGVVKRYEPPGFSGAHRDRGFANVVWRFVG